MEILILKLNSKLNLIGKVYRNTNTGTYATTNQIAGLPLTKGTYLLIGTIISGEKIRDIELRNKTINVQISRSYASDDNTGTTSQCIGTTVLSENADVVMMFTPFAFATFTGTLTAIQIV